MMIQILSCALLVTFSGSSPVPRGNDVVWFLKPSPQAQSHQMDQDQQWLEKDQGEINSRLFSFKYPDQSINKETYGFNHVQPARLATQRKPDKSHDGSKSWDLSWFWDISAKYILPSLTKYAMHNLMNPKNNRRSSFYNNFEDQSVQKNIKDNNYTGRFPNNQLFSFYNMDQSDRKNDETPSHDLGEQVSSYGEDQLEYDDYPGKKEVGGRRSLALLAGIAQTFLRPIFGGFQAKIDVSQDIKYQAELSALHKVRLDISAALAAKERQEHLQAMSLSEKLKNEAEINQLRMQLELLKMQKDSDHAIREKQMAALISEEKFRALKEELSHKLRMDYELEISKLRQENSNSFSSYQNQLNHQSNQEIVDRTVVQPIVEFRPAVIKGSPQQFLNSPQLNNQYKGQIVHRPEVTQSFTHEFENSHSTNFKFQNNLNHGSSVNEESNSYWLEG